MLNFKICILIVINKTVKKVQKFVMLTKCITKKINYGYDILLKLVFQLKMYLFKKKKNQQ